MRTIVVNGRWGRESAQVFCTPADEAKTVARDPALQHDVELAKQANVDLSVFGIIIGEPLPLQPCDARDGDSVNQSCITEGDMSTAFLTSTWPKLPGGQELYVHVRADACPNWLSYCTVAVSVKGGSVYAALARVSGADHQEEMEGRLQQKYHGSVDKSRFAQCTTELGVVAQRAAVRVWSMQGLRVVYNPLGAGCSVGVAMAGSGLVSVETPTFRNSISEEQRARDAAQPKM
jgi:hypothetical protein